MLIVGILCGAVRDRTQQIGSGESANPSASRMFCRYYHWDCVVVSEMGGSGLAMGARVRAAAEAESRGGQAGRAGGRARGHAAAPRAPRAAHRRRTSCCRTSFHTRCHCRRCNHGIRSRQSHGPRWCALVQPANASACAATFLVLKLPNKRPPPRRQLRMSPKLLTLPSAVHLQAELLWL